MAHTESPGTYTVLPSVARGQSHFTRVVVFNAAGYERDEWSTPVTPYHPPMWDDATQTATTWISECSCTYVTKRDAADAVRALRALGYTRRK